jgi:hypothetical protein
VFPFKILDGSTIGGGCCVCNRLFKILNAALWPGWLRRKGWPIEALPREAKALDGPELPKKVVRLDHESYVRLRWHSSSKIQILLFRVPEENTVGKSMGYKCVHNFAGDV